MNSSKSSIQLVAGRALISWIFLYSSVSQMTDFAANVSHVAAAGMPFPKLAIMTSIAIQFLGGLALLLGFKTRIAAWALFILLIPITIVLHKFWAPGAPHTQEIQFFKNMAAMGGLLFVAEFGGGPYSIDKLGK